MICNENERRYGEVRGSLPGDRGGVCPRSDRGRRASARPPSDETPGARGIPGRRDLPAACLGGRKGRASRL
eukprot:31354-Pelagococcus_subviridis.AAC.21